MKVGALRNRLLLSLLAAIFRGNSNLIKSLFAHCILQITDKNVIRCMNMAVALLQTGSQVIPMARAELYVTHLKVKLLKTGAHVANIAPFSSQFCWVFYNNPES